MKKILEEDGWRGFLETCLRAKSVKELSDLFRLFMTHTEREEMASRFLIIRELLKGEKTQREIARDLDVSIAYITRGSNELKIIGPDLRKFLEK